MSSTRFLVVLDADSTLLEDEIIEVLAEEAGARDEVHAITAQAMHGDLDFAESLHLRAAVLAGLPVSAFDAARRRIRVTAGAAALIDGVHAAGGSVGVVSGGFHEVLDPVTAALGLDHRRANRFEVRDGILTGRVTGEIVDRPAKADTLRAWAEQDGIPLARTVAVGDGANDLGMMAVAGLAVGFDPTPIVREHADLILPDRDLAPVLATLGLRG